MEVTLQEVVVLVLQVGKSAIISTQLWLGEQSLYASTHRRKHTRGG